MKNFEKLFKRLFYSSIATILVVLLVFFSHMLIVKGLLFLFIAALAVFGVWEYGQMLKVKQLNVGKGVLELGAFAVVFSFFLSTFLEQYFYAPFISFLLFVILFFVLHFKKRQNPIESVAVQTFALIYVAFPLALFFPLVYFSGIDGRWWVFYLLVVTKIFDVAAYFGGKLFGKRKLAPAISPNKTVEGAFFGLVFSVLASLYFAYLGKTGVIDLSLSYQKALPLGAILGIMGQVGDLSESLLKRDAKIKDSNSLPGLGGVLDMVDSLLFTTPILYLTIKQGLLL